MNNQQKERVIIKGDANPIRNLFIMFTVAIAVATVVSIVMYSIDSTTYWPLLVISLILLIITIIFTLLYWKIQICVTDKRVMGSTTFGRKVDLPLDSISAIGSAALGGIAVGTSSGKISFSGISNANDIRAELNKLMSERQSKKAENTIVQNVVQNSDAGELKKFKELLDAGVITQEEFDAKKKQLLGL